MKTILALCFCAVLFTVKAEDQIRITRHGTNVTAQPNAVFTTKIVRLLESCQFNSTDYAVKAETWRQRERADSVVVLTFSPPRSLTVCTFTPVDDLSVSNNVVAWFELRRAKREIKTIDAILVTLTEKQLPDHIFAKSGTNVIAVTKFSPFILKEVAFEPVLYLSSGTAYESLPSLPSPAHSQDAQVAGQRMAAGGTQTTNIVRWNLSTEDLQPAKVKVEIRTGGVPDNVMISTNDIPAGKGELPLSKVSDGECFVFFSFPGYATQWRYLKVKEGKTEPGEMSVKLFRRRYLVLRYVFNTSHSRDFSDSTAVKEGRAAVSHWGSLPHFQEDWQVWQGSIGTDRAGDTLFLQIHRPVRGFGFAKAPEGIAFDDLKEVPADAEFKNQNLKVEKGMTLFCRVRGNPDPGQDALGYGKLMVEDITETPPAGVEVMGEP